MGREGDEIKTRGGVHFPVNSRRWVDSKEGGLTVQLWVVPKMEKGMPTWANCFGANRVTVFHNEVLIGTSTKDNDDVCEKGVQRFPLEELLFPVDQWPDKFEAPGRREQSQFSVPLLALPKGRPVRDREKPA